MVSPEMDGTDTLINALYCGATEGDWQSFRGRALNLLCERYGASAAAWWSRGSRDDEGALTQHPQPFVTPSALAKLALPAGQETAVLEVSPTTQAFVYAARGGDLTHTVVLNYLARGK